MRKPIYRRGDKLRVLLRSAKLRVEVGTVLVATADSDKGCVSARRPDGTVHVFRTNILELHRDAAPVPAPVPAPQPAVQIAPGNARKMWMIAVLDGDQPLPAARPKLYESEKQAHAVAKGMAERHRGSTFVVFEATGFTHLPLTVSTEVTRL